MISLEQLIQIASFPEETKRELVEKLETLSPDKRFELIQMCWALISADYQNKLSFERQKATLEMAKGEKTYSKEDFQEMEDKLFLELTNKLELTGNQEELEEVREKLKSQMPNPLSS